MFWKNILNATALLLPIAVALLVSLDLIPTGFGVQLNQNNRVIVTVFTLTAFLLVMHSISYAKSLEIIGIMFYFLSTTVILLSNSLITMICAWEAAALAAILILSSSCKSIGPVLRYATIHFIGGALIIAAIPYHCIFAKISWTIELLNNAQLILLAIGILINCAAFPLSIWVTDSYPAASPHATAALQLFVTKSALFMLFTIFGGYDILTAIGFITAIYALIYSLWQNKLRKILAYNTVGQMGLLISSVGFGANIIPYLLSSIIYQTTMYMVASSVIHATGKENLRDLGGLFKKLPIIGVSGIIALLAMSALPLTISFNSKHLIIESINSPLLLILFLIISAGLIMSCGLRVVYFTFFHKKNYLERVTQTSLNSTVAVVVVAVLCISPLIKVESAYSFSLILEQLLLFVFTCVIFYWIRLPWYNMKYRLVEIDFIYRVFGIKLLSTIEIAIVKSWSKVYHFLSQRIINGLRTLDNITFDSISYTVVCAIVIIGILVRLYV